MFLCGGLAANKIQLKKRVYARDSVDFENNKEHQKSALKEGFLLKFKILHNKYCQLKLAFIFIG